MNEWMNEWRKMMMIIKSQRYQSCWSQHNSATGYDDPQWPPMTPSESTCSTTRLLIGGSSVLLIGGINKSLLLLSYSWNSTQPNIIHRVHLGKRPDHCGPIDLIHPTKPRPFCSWSLSGIAADSPNHNKMWINEKSMKLKNNNSKKKKKFKKSTFELKYKKKLSRPTQYTETGRSIEVDISKI